MTDLNFTELTWADFMEKYFRRARAFNIRKALAAADAAQFYGFRCTDVKTVHFEMQGFGEGCWFRLKDDRVVSWLGEPADPDPVYYTAMTKH
jgi:hypothetical protein